MKPKNRWLTGGLVLLAVSAAACGAAQAPTLVASYPRPSSGGNTSPGVADGPIIVETVYLTLEVNDPEGAADAAARLAYGYGGYEADRYAWDSDNGRAVAQEIFIPLDQSDPFHSRLLQIGRKTLESSVRNSGAVYRSGHLWAEFSIQYLPRGYAVEWDHSFAWRFQQAVYSFAAQAAAFLLHAAASLLIAAVIVIPCVWMIVGAVTTIRWLFRAK